MREEDAAQTIIHWVDLSVNRKQGPGRELPIVLPSGRDQAQLLGDAVQTPGVHQGAAPSASSSQNLHAGSSHFHYEMVSILLESADYLSSVVDEGPVLAEKYIRSTNVC